MEPAAHIRISARQSWGDPQPLEQEAEGSFLREEGGCTLTYEEGPGTGMEGTLTTLRLRGDRLLLERRGPVRVRMLFQPGHRHTCRYETPCGSLDMTLETHRLDCRLDGEGGVLELAYAVELNGAAAGENLLRITVEKRRTTQ